MAPIQTDDESSSAYYQEPQPRLEAVRVGVTQLAVPTPPPASELSDWEWRTWEMDASAAAQLGFPVGSTKLSGRRHVLISEFSRSKTVSENGKRVRYGVAVRLLVELTRIDASGGLNLPLVAAQAQMGATSASSQLYVEGYVGSDLAKLIPREQQFNVESYVRLMKAVSDIQKLVSRKESNIRPKPLEIPEIVVASEEDRDTALGIVWAMSNIADGKSCSDCLSKLASSAFAGSPAVVEAVRATYRDAIGNNERTVPSEAQRQVLRDRLGPLRLKK